MTNTPESFNLDVRIRDRMLRKQVITNSSVDQHLAQLSDVEAQAVTLDLEQPALAKPPVAAPAPVQPVVQPRLGGADLPPPPPGLIKESPTPPYTPMVIESIPRAAAVNGSQSNEASYDDEEDDDEIDDEGDEPAVEAQAAAAAAVPAAVAAPEPAPAAAPEPAAAAAPEPVAAPAAAPEPAPMSRPSLAAGPEATAIDDEWS